MKTTVILAVAMLLPAQVYAQEFVTKHPAGKQNNVFAAVANGLVAETRASARDLVTFHDREWSLLTFAQIGAATVDAQTSLHNLRVCPNCEEDGLSRWVVGRHPDVHKYVVAGLVEISVETVLSHYLRRHIPSHKWYWRYAWALPQSISLYEHAHSSLHNAGLRFKCNSTGLNCY